VNPPSLEPVHDPRVPATTKLTNGAGVTLDHLFRYAAVQRPDEVALIDASNRAAFTSGAPRTLTYREARTAMLR
jgi:hypothetical protein